MTQTMPQGTKCAGCDLPIKDTESFVAYRFGGGVRFWHNRFRVIDDCWGKFLLEHVQRVHCLHAMQAN
jgi:hypothetical protein